MKSSFHPLWGELSISYSFLTKSSNLHTLLLTRLLKSVFIGRMEICSYRCECGDFCHLKLQSMFLLPLCKHGQDVYLWQQDWALWVADTAVCISRVCIGKMSQARVERRISTYITQSKQRQLCALNKIWMKYWKSFLSV